MLFFNDTTLLQIFHGSENNSNELGEQFELRKIC